MNTWRTSKYMAAYASSIRTAVVIFAFATFVVLVTGAAIWLVDKNDSSK